MRKTVDIIVATMSCFRSIDVTGKDVICHHSHKRSWQHCSFFLLIANDLNAEVLRRIKQWMVLLLIQIFLIVMDFCYTNSETTHSLLYSNIFVALDHRTLV